MRVTKNAIPCRGKAWRFDDARRLCFRRGLYRFLDVSLYLRLNLVLLLLSRPVWTVGIHLIQPLLDFGIAAGELAHQLSPTRHQTLGYRSCRIFIQRRLYVAKKLVPLTSHALLQFWRPKALAILDLCLGVVAEVLVCPICIVLHANPPDDLCDERPIGLLR